MKQSFETLARQVNQDINLSILPPYFKGLLELVARCVRRPNAVAKMARRAEWLIVGQMVGNLGAPPWRFTDEDLIGSKLLSDVARFMVQVSGLKPSFLEAYVDLLRDWETEQDNAGVVDVDLYAKLDNQTHQEEIHFSYAEVGQIDSSELPTNDALEGHL